MSSAPRPFDVKAGGLVNVEPPSSGKCEKCRTNLDLTPCPTCNTSESWLRYVRLRNHSSTGGTTEIGRIAVVAKTV
jgi:hypothetical protein